MRCYVVFSDKVLYSDNDRCQVISLLRWSMRGKSGAHIQAKWGQSSNNTSVERVFLQGCNGMLLQGKF